jgi:hypothetical protein
MDPLTQWLHVTGRFIKKDENKDFTHLMLNGGCLHISNHEDNELFLNMYSKYLKKNNYYLIEKKTNIFKMFLDLDFIDKDVINIVEITSCIQNVINFFYEKEFLCIVCTADNKIIVKQNTEYIKQGFHLHWPDLYVDTKTSKQIRNSIVTKLQTIYGKPESRFNNWNDIVDECVLEKNGLRLCGSHKGHYADGKFIHEGRPYFPKFTMKISGELDDKELEKLKDLNYMVKKCSIRTNVENIIPVKNIPVGMTVCDKENFDENEELSSDRLRLGSSSIEYKEIIRFFKNHVKDYKSDDIKKIFNYSNGKTYIILTRSKYCQNICRNHNSCQIYFKLTPYGICQKCHCKCDTMEGRKYGYCKDFSSTPVPCSKHILKLLKWNIKNTDIIKKDISVTSFRDLLYNNFTNKSPLRGRGKGSSNNK